MLYPLHRFRAMATLSGAEEEALRQMGGPTVRHRNHTTIQREGEPARGIYLLLDGWVTSSVMLPSGKRLVQKVHLPGDMLSSPSMVLPIAADALHAVTDATTSLVTYDEIGEWFVSHPRLAALFMMAAQFERLALMDALSSRSHASAREQLARLLLDIHARLTPIGYVFDDAFDLPLTQELIGDLLGLTGVHVNRMFRILNDKGLIKREGHRIRLDVAGLKKVSPIAQRHIRFEPDWLPAQLDDVTSLVSAAA